MCKRKALSVAKWTSIWMLTISFLNLNNIMAQELSEVPLETTVEKIEKLIDATRNELNDQKTKIDSILYAVQKAHRIKLFSDEKIILDSIKKLEKPLGLLKFRGNHLRKKKLLIYRSILSFIQQRNKMIDTVSAKEREAHLKDLEEKIKNFENTIDNLKNTEIEDPSKEEKANKAIVKYLLEKDSITTASINDPLESKKTALRDSTDTIYEKIRSFKKGVSIICDTLGTKDTVYDCEECLTKKVRVMGWHNAWKKNDPENYYLRPFSSLNYFGYELVADGKINRPVDLLEDPLPPLLNRAKQDGLEIYLTVFSKDPKLISTFLNSPFYQDKVLLELEKLFDGKIIDGININFEDVALSDQNRFTRFIEKLKILETNKAPHLKLMVTIPAISNAGDVERLAAYKFVELNEHQCLYLVKTNRLINGNEGSPQSFSPLDNSNESESGTIRSTIDQLVDKGVHKKDLFITISYSGVQWEVIKSGDLKRDTPGKELSYGTILDKLKVLKDSSIKTVEGYDPLQASSYVYYVEKQKNKKDTYHEIWYDGELGLNKKLKWAADEQMAGIVIHGVDDDDSAQRFGGDYSRLEKILTSAVVELDTCKTIVPAWRGYSAIFLDDVKWAMLNEPTEKEEWEYKGHLEKLVKEWEHRKNQKHFDYFIGWDEQFFLGSNVKEYPQKNDTDEILAEDPVFDSLDQCLFAFLRWRIYARIFLYAFLFFSVFTLCLRWLKTWFIRYPPKNKMAKKICDFFLVFFFIGAALFLLGYLYFEPDIDIGGSENQWIALDTLIILLTIGFIFGHFLAPYLRNQNLVRKNMP